VASTSVHVAFSQLQGRCRTLFDLRAGGGLPAVEAVLVAYGPGGAGELVQQWYRTQGGLTLPVALPAHQIAIEFDGPEARLTMAAGMRAALTAAVMHAPGHGGGGSSAGPQRRKRGGGGGGDGGAAKLPRLPPALPSLAAMWRATMLQHEGWVVARVPYTAFRWQPAPGAAAGVGAAGSGTSPPHIWLPHVNSLETAAVLARYLPQQLVRQQRRGGGSAASSW
jgi:hypothetical protein